MWICSPRTFRRFFRFYCSGLPSSRATLQRSCYIRQFNAKPCKVTRRELILQALTTSLAASQTTSPSVAITIDDFRWKQIPLPDPEETNRTLLSALAKRSNLKAAVFVAGQNVDDIHGRQLLQAWSDAGHHIGNHTYSHPFYPNITAARFIEDIERGEGIVSGYPSFQSYKMFRFPLLKEGETAAKRDQVRTYLAKHGYHNGHVTIDTSDWYYDQRLRERLKSTPHFNPKPYRDVYLEHIWDRAMYYDNLARDILGHTVPHTILLHYTLINVLFLDDLLRMFENKGWKLASARNTFADPLFSKNPDYIPAGESLIWALAQVSPKFAGKLRYPGEDDIYEKAKLDRLGL